MAGPGGNSLPCLDSVARMDGISASSAITMKRILDLIDKLILYFVVAFFLAAALIISLAYYADVVKSPKLGDLSLPISGFYMLAVPSALAGRSSPLADFLPDDIDLRSEDRFAPGVRS
jgi:hypothetical protein